jgi:hypothetical protein
MRDSPSFLIDPLAAEENGSLVAGKRLSSEWPGQLVQIRINLGQLGMRFEQFLIGMGLEWVFGRESGTFTWSRGAQIS